MWRALLIIAGVSAACALCAVGLAVVAGTGAAVFFTVVPPTMDPNAQWIPGLTSGAISRRLQPGAIACRSPSAGNSGLEDWYRTGGDLGARYTASWYGMDASHIGWANFAVGQSGGSPEDKLAADCLAELVRLPYAGADPDRAAAWVRRTLEAAPAGAERERGFTTPSPSPSTGRHGHRHRPHVAAMWLSVSSSGA
jgi:hypothetical protein